GWCPGWRACAPTDPCIERIFPSCGENTSLPKSKKNPRYRGDDARSGGRQIAQTGGNSPKLTIPLNQNLYTERCTPRAMRNLLNPQATARGSFRFREPFYRFRKSARLSPPFPGVTSEMPNPGQPPNIRRTLPDFWRLYQGLPRGTRHAPLFPTPEPGAWRVFAPASRLSPA